MVLSTWGIYKAVENNRARNKCRRLLVRSDFQTSLLVFNKMVRGKVSCRVREDEWEKSEAWQSFKVVILHSADGHSTCTSPVRLRPSPEMTPTPEGKKIGGNVAENPSMCLAALSNTQTASCIAKILSRVGASESHKIELNSMRRRRSSSRDVLWQSPKT